MSHGIFTLYYSSCDKRRQTLSYLAEILVNLYFNGLLLYRYAEMADVLPQPILTIPIPKSSPAACIFIRPNHHSYATGLADLANNARVAATMSSRFPHPYTVADAESWITQCLTLTPQTCQSTESPLCLLPGHEQKKLLTTSDSTLHLTRYVVTLNDVPIGQIGLEFSFPNTHQAHTAVLGYWFGEPYWGKGYATLVARAFVGWTFETFPWVNRVQAESYGWNPGSARVLEKCGLREEGRLRKAVIAKGKVGDLLLFGLLREEWEEQRGQARV